MEFSVEKFVSNFVENQFPEFYREEGPDFILFTKAYYEWMEASGNPIGESRRLLDFRDLDNTPEEFLVHFQQKYLYGIPFNVIINKRLLLKHILDVYRSKGSINCYKLLFKMVYNEDIEVYLPSVDVLRVSDGTWIEPQYIEVTNFENVNDFMGQTIVGVNSGVTATVENIIRETFYDNETTIVYFSNLIPKGATFEVGENIIPQVKLGNFDFISKAPYVLGSIDTIDIIDGGRDFNVNDLIRVVQRDTVTNENIAYGKESYLKVVELRKGQGELSFDLIDGGFGFSQDSEIFIYRNDDTGVGASFELGTLINQIQIEYNKDIVSDYLQKSLDASTYGFPAYPSANLDSTIAESFDYSSKIFGTIGSLVNIYSGNGYVRAANVFVRSVNLSNTIAANVSYNTSNTIVTFQSSEQITPYASTLLGAVAYTFPRNTTANVSSTLESTISLSNFYNFFSKDSVICLQANSDISSRETHIVKDVLGFDSLELYANPKYNSTSTATFRAASVILPSNFTPNESIMNSPNELVNGVNEEIISFPSLGNNIAAKLKGLTGKGFYEGERVKAGLYGTINSNIEIAVPGIGYSNNDALIFPFGKYNKQAKGYVVTDNLGKIIDTVITDKGFGYTTGFEVTIQTKTGSGATLNCSVVDFDYGNLITGKVRKKGTGKEFGYYSTTRGFLNSDKYIQDSYYYQDYSYEIRVPRSLNKYKNILYETFHIAGTELFGKFDLVSEEGTDSEILSENTTAIIRR